MTVFSFDTETFLITPGRQAPPMVCVQFALDAGEPEILHVKDRDCVEQLAVALKHYTLNGHNLAYDMAVICATFPDLTPLVFKAYAEDRATCTALRQKLIDLADGKYVKQGGYGLSDCYVRAGGEPLDKTDPWRLKYGTLIDTPVTAWPAEAVRYALADATAQRDLYAFQERRKAVLDDQYRQSRKAFALHLSSCWGIQVDPEAALEYHAEVLEGLLRDKKACQDAGLVDWKGKKNTKLAMARMVQVMESLGEEPAKTESGQVSITEDDCLASGDDLLQAYQRYGSARTLRSKAERLFRGVHTPLQTRYDPLRETGRTSCSQGEDPKPGPDGIVRMPPQWGIQIQNLPRKGGMRRCFVPRPGHWIAQIDYGGIELCTWAQACLWAVKRSRLATVINDGGDPHTDLGALIARIPYAEAAALTGDAKRAFKGGPRQTAKIANFGYPGGMGPATLARQARTIYRVMMTHPEAYALRDQWRSNWPEAVDYFAWVNDLIRRGDGERATVQHFKSNRWRRGIPYTVTCNTFFQGLAADLAGDTLWELTREMYLGGTALAGCRLLWFVHDEFGIEVPAHPERAHLAAMRLQEVALTMAQRWVPDVRVSGEAQLMTRWEKNAEPVWKNGMLVPWVEAA